MCTITPQIASGEPNPTPSAMIPMCSRLGDARQRAKERQEGGKGGAVMERGRGGVQGAPVEGVQAVMVKSSLGDRDDYDSQQRDRQPERRQHEVLPARLERAAPPAERDEQR